LKLKEEALCWKKHFGLSRGLSHEKVKAIRIEFFFADMICYTESGDDIASDCGGLFLQKKDIFIKRGMK
jgi:hypothetical protein